MPRLILVVLLLSLWLPRARAADAPAWPDVAAPLPGVAVDGAGDVALVVGVEHYLHRSMPPVPGAAQNARDWAAYLEARGVPVVALLLDDAATRENIEQKAQSLAPLRQPGGRAWFVFVGHGAPAARVTAATAGVAAGPAEGALLGVDAQSTASSIVDRSLSPGDVATALGVTADVEYNAVIDACFSGLSPAGSPLATDKVQPVRPVTVVTPPRGAVLVAASGQQFAGPLPGLERPAFSWLVLGALRGWGDRDGDGAVSAAEAGRFASERLAALVSSRVQEPEAHGDIARPWSVGAREAAPVLGRAASALGLPVRPSDTLAPTRAASAPAGQLARWDFEGEGLQGWTAARGQWLAMEGQLAQNSYEGPALAYAGDETWTDYRLEADFTRIDGPDAVLVSVRATAASGAIQWALGGWGNTKAKVQLRDELGGTARTRDLETTATPLALVTGRRHHLRVDVQGAHVVGWVDGAKLLDFTDPEVALRPAGRVGLGSWASRVFFDNVVVTALPTTPVPDAQVAPPTRRDELLRATFTGAGLGGFVPLGGGWVNMDGRLAQYRHDRGVRALAGNPAWVDYALDFDVQKLDGRDAILVVFRAREGRGALQWVLGGWGNTTAKLEVLGDIRARDPLRRLEHTARAFSLEPGRTYHVRLEVRGAHVTGLIDGDVYLDLSDPEVAAQASGMVGLGTWETRAWFDNVVVTRL